MNGNESAFKQQINLKNVIEYSLTMKKRGYIAINYLIELGKKNRIMHGKVRILPVVIDANGF